MCDGLTPSEVPGKIAKQYGFKLRQQQVADRRTAEGFIKIFPGVVGEHAYEILPQSASRNEDNLWCGGGKVLLRSECIRPLPWRVNVGAKRPIFLDCKGTVFVGSKAIRPCPSSSCGPEHYEVKDARWGQVQR